MLKKAFRENIELFLEKTHIPTYKIGRLAINDPKFVTNVRNGREFREATQEKVIKFMRGYAAEHGIDFKISQEEKSYD